MNKVNLDFKTKFIIVFLLIILSPFIFSGMFIFAGHGFEPLIAALHLREMNRIGEPLAIGETWSEKHFDFAITDITDLSKRDKERDKENDVCKYSINIKLDNKSLQMLQYDVYVCANDVNDEMLACPLPDDKEGSFEYDKEHTLTFITPPKTDYVDIVVRVPYSKHRHYMNKYRFYLP